MCRSWWFLSNVDIVDIYWLLQVRCTRNQIKIIKAKDIFLQIQNNTIGAEWRIQEQRWSPWWPWSPASPRRMTTSWSATAWPRTRPRTSSTSSSRTAQCRTFWLMRRWGGVVLSVNIPQLSNTPPQYCRSDQHRHNYATLKTQHQNILHQLKIMEAEIVKLETEKHDLQAEIRWQIHLSTSTFLSGLLCSGLVDNAVNETNGLKREIALLESQLPTEESQKQLESRIRNETGDMSCPIQCHSI